MFYIVILNWNGWGDTFNCIESVVRETKAADYTIVLVDNGSHAEEIDRILKYSEHRFKNVLIGDKEYFLNKSNIIDDDFSSSPSSERIIIIKNNENLGFARGNNVALKFIENNGGKFALLLNNDTEIEDDALSAMYNFMISSSDKNCAAVIPQIRYYDPSDVIWNCGGSINMIGVRRYDYAFKNILEVPQNGFKRVDYGTGCAILLNLNITSLLSDKFFFGEEDFELAFRLKKERKSVYCVYDSVVYHKVGSSRGRISEEKMGNMVYHYSQRMSNLRDQMNIFLWFISVFAHFLSTARILRREPFFKVNKLFSMWNDILTNVKKIKRFERADFLKITSKKY